MCPIPTDGHGAECHNRFGDDAEAKRAARLEGYATALRAMLPPETQAIPTEFGRWLDVQIGGARTTTAGLAGRYHTLRNLRPRRGDGRWKGSKHPPKKEMGAYRRGDRVPGPEVAYRIGRALEQIAAETDVVRNRESVLTNDPTLETMRLDEYSVEGGAANGLDALLMAGYYAEIIACLGTWLGPDEVAPYAFEYHAFAEALQGNLIGATLPAYCYPSLDAAWVTWLTDRDLSLLPPIFQAAYILAGRPRPQGADEDVQEYDQRRARAVQAAQNLFDDWSPRRYRLDS